MNRRDSLRRRRAFRQPLRRFLIVCEGQVTEKCYFSDLRQLDRAPVQFEFIAGAVPKTLVERAVARKRASEQAADRERDVNQLFDEIWVVCDVDEHPRVADATQQARDNGIRVAISNPCFELWALLHFQEQSSHIHRHSVQRLCRQYMPSYKKKLPCHVLMTHYDKAYERAVHLGRWHERRGTLGANPSTNVHDLVQSIRNVRKDSRRAQGDIPHVG